MRKNRINDNCINILISNLLKIKKLRKLELDVSVNNIGDVGAAKIKQYQFGIADLLVDLRWNNIGNKQC